MIYSSGIQSFSELRHYGCKYVDKTNYLYNLINSGKHFYLCRPRRFGKSYHLIFHLLFSCIGSTIRSEVSIASGRIDCAITTSKYNYIVELKTDQTAEIALNQIEVKEYYNPYLAEDKPIILIGININTTKKKELSWVTREMVKN